MNSTQGQLIVLHKELITYVLLFTLCSIMFLLSIQQRKYTHIRSLLPNICSMFIFGPIFLIVGGFTTTYIGLYIVLGIISTGLLVSIIYGMCKEKRRLTLLRCVYLLLFIPLLLYISIRKEYSNMFARRTLLIIGIIYMAYNIQMVCFNSMSNTTSIFKGAPQHPIRRLIDILDPL